MRLGAPRLQKRDSQLSETVSDFLVYTSMGSMLCVGAGGPVTVIVQSPFCRVVFSR